jgi:hypothetical protein
MLQTSIIVLLRYITCHGPGYVVGANYAHHTTPIEAVEQTCIHVCNVQVQSFFS